MQLAYIKEATPNTTPATPTGQILRATSFNGNIKVPVIESKEMRSDRQRAPGAVGVIEAAPTIGGEVSYGTLDDILEALLGGTWTTNVLKVGTSYVPTTITLEHKDEGTTATRYQPYKGMAINKLTISGGLGQNVEYSLDGVAMSVPADTAATLFTGVTAANTNPVYGPATGEGSVSLAGTALTGCTKWSFTYDNSAIVNRAVYQTAAHSIRQKGIKITASLDIYHEDQTQYGRLKAGTEIACKLVLGNDTTKSYNFDHARARVIDVSCPEAEGVRVETVTLEMFVPASGTDTACKVTRKV